MQIAAPPSSVTDTAHFTAAILSNREWRLIAKLRPKASPFFVKYISDERVPASEYKHAPQNKGDHKMIRAILRAAIPVCCLATSASAQDVKRIAVNGTELAYVETGKGDPAIFVHGGLQDYRMWAGHLSKFSDHYRVIAYSRRNNFPNDVSTDGMSPRFLTARDRHLWPRLPAGSGSAGRPGSFPSFHGQGRSMSWDPVILPSR